MLYQCPASRLLYFQQLLRYDYLAVTLLKLRCLPFGLPLALDLLGFSLPGFHFLVLVSHVNDDSYWLFQRGHLMCYVEGEAEYVRG